MSAESWKPVAGYEDLYEVSDRGRIQRIANFGPKSRKPPYVLKQQRHNHGYLSVALHAGAINGARQQRTFLVHRLVAAAFIGPSGLSVNHKNGDKHDNHIDNLEYMTLQENAAHSVENGLHASGVAIKTSKLTPDDVRAIRISFDAGENYKAIAAKYSVHPMNIYHIVNRKTWRQVA